LLSSDSRAAKADLNFDGSAIPGEPVERVLNLISLSLNFNTIIAEIPDTDNLPGLKENFSE